MTDVYGLMVFALTVAVAAVMCIRAVKKGDGAFRALYIALFYLSLFSAYLFKLSNVSPTVHAFIPFYKLFALNEYGYASILHDMLIYACPFILTGLFSLPAYPRFGIEGAALFAFFAAFVFNAHSLFVGASFVSDEYILAAIGGASGAAIYVIAAWFLRKKFRLESIGLPVPLRKRASRSAFLLIGVYLFIALVMVFDHGIDYAGIQFFESETPLPDSIALNCALSDKQEKVRIYIPSTQSVEDRANAISRELGISSAVSAADGIYTAADGERKFTMTESGSWVYEFTAVPEGETPTVESATSAIYDLFNTHVLLTVSADEITDIMEHSDANGKLDGYDVYLSTAVGGVPIIGSSNLVVSVRLGNIITKIRRYDGDILSGKTVTIISEQKAYELYLEGNCAYTLFSPAKSATINSCYLSYMANSSQGYYLPVWVFSCTADYEDGTQGGFSIYVEATK